MLWSCSQGAGDPVREPSYVPAKESRTVSKNSIIEGQNIKPDGK